MEKVKKSTLQKLSGLESLQIQLPGSINNNDGIQVLTLSNEIGIGEVKYQNIQKGIKIFDFDITLVKDTAIPIESLSEEQLKFFYCLDGNCVHQFNSKDDSVSLEQFQTAVAHNEKGILNTIFVNKDERLILNIIFINKEEYFKKFHEKPNQFGERLGELLQEISEKTKYFHSGGFNLKIAEQLKLLIGVEHTNDISEQLSQKGRYYIILAKQIEQFYNEVNNSSNSSSLLKNELHNISEVSEYIKNFPEIQHSIKSLCKKSGLSPAKLQEGFKFMYERTVTDFVRNVRLEKAVILINTTDLTISEIVYSVGLTSRSYFCKIFKKKHKCSPKEFRSKIKADNKKTIVA